MAFQMRNKFSNSFSSKLIFYVRFIYSDYYFFYIIYITLVRRFEHSCWYLKIVPRITGSLSAPYLFYFIYSLQWFISITIIIIYELWKRNIIFNVTIGKSFFYLRIPFHLSQANVVLCLLFEFLQKSVEVRL